MNRISTYEELRAERKKLEGELLIQKTYITTHFAAIKAKFEPIGKILSFVGGFKNGTKSNTLLKIGSSVGIDLLVGQKLRKVGWLARTILPFVMKLTAQKTIDKVQNKMSK